MAGKNVELLSLLFPMAFLAMIHPLHINSESLGINLVRPGKTITIAEEL